MMMQSRGKDRHILFDTLKYRCLKRCNNPQICWYVMLCSTRNSAGKNFTNMRMIRMEGQAWDAVMSVLQEEIKSRQCCCLIQTMHSIGAIAQYLRQKKCFGKASKMTLIAKDANSRMSFGHILNTMKLRSVVRCIDAEFAVFFWMKGRIGNLNNTMRTIAYSASILMEG